MQVAHPLSLLLVVLLAFWMPVGQCCAVEAEAPAPAEHESLPPCHPQPTDAPAPCDSRSDCDDDTCDCTPLMRSACQSDRNLAATVAPTDSQLPLVTAALLPVSMQPHTFTGRPAAFLSNTAPPPAAAPSLVALSCQLTL